LPNVIFASCTDRTVQIGRRSPWSTSPAPQEKPGLSFSALVLVTFSKLVYRSDRRILGIRRQPWKRACSRYWY
jgi:hypothetical protein